MTGSVPLARMPLEVVTLMMALYSDQDPDVLTCHHTPGWGEGRGVGVGWGGVGGGGGGGP